MSSNKHSKLTVIIFVMLFNRDGILDAGSRCSLRWEKMVVSYLKPSKSKYLIQFRDVVISSAIHPFIGMHSRCFISKLRINCEMREKHVSLNIRAVSSS